MLCHQYTAADAERMGWVNRVVPDEALDAAVDEWCQELLPEEPHRAARRQAQRLHGRWGPGSPAAGPPTYTASSSRPTVMAASTRTDSHVEGALEPDERAGVGHAARELRAVREHRERALQRAAALDELIHDGLVLGGYLRRAGDGRQSCHGRLRRVDRLPA